MNIKLIKFLAAICAGLCFLIVCEWLYAIYAQKHLLESVQATEKQKKIIAKLPTVVLKKQAESSYVDLVNRPLFIQGRKPVIESPTVAAPTTTTTETFNWALNGVYTHKNSLYALFSRTTTKVAKDNFRKVTKDSDIDGWKLTEIQKDKVVVSQGSKQKELPLRKPKPKTPPTTADRGLVPPPIPNPSERPLIPGQQQPIPVPEPVIEPEVLQPPDEIILEPELIPDESSEPFFENSENEQFQ